MIIDYHKNIGESMNDVIDRFKQEYNLKKEKITYAGRLDPLAFGKVVILTDKDIYKRDEYCKYNKTYKFKLIHGIQTDTFDILGIMTNINNVFTDKIEMKEYKMFYPEYSGYKINGKPYWYWSKKNIKIADSDKPFKKIIVDSFKKINETKTDNKELLNIIKEKINTITKNTFRQDEIIEKYKTDLSADTYIISEFIIGLSSGGFVRFFGNMLGGTCFDIERLEYIKN